MTKENFEFEDLHVWKKSIAFVDEIFELIDKIESDRRHFRLIEQIESSCVSIPANIAEGKGRHTHKDYLRFLYYS
jgi:four helix bundle protein